MTEAAMEFKAPIREYVLTAVNLTEVDDEENLFEAGFVNSLFAVQLIAFLEKSFGIEVGADDMDIENFKSINATASFVMAKKDGGSLRGDQC